MPPHPRVEAVLFDLDGTLIDSVPIYLNLVAAVLNTLGMPQVPRKAVVVGLRDGNFNWQAVLPKGDPGRNKKLAAAAQKLVPEIAPRMFRQEMKLIPGVDAALAQLSGNGRRIGLVTSTPRQNLAIKLRLLRESGCDRYFEAIVDADDVKARKPAPDALFACCRKMKVASESCVYVGDTRTDMQAANAAGMPAVAVLTGFDDAAELMVEEPVAIIPSVIALPRFLNHIHAGRSLDLEAR